MESGWPLGKELDELIVRAIAEDMGSGDVTTQSLVPANASAEAHIVARTDGVVSGTKVAAAVFRHLDPKITIKIVSADGERVGPGAVLLHVKGAARAILSGERTALNFMQRMSGIATETSRYVEEVKPYGVRILDTRKTTPTLRALEKYAVQCGGGENHRLGLYDRVMIKDNHLAFWRRLEGSTAEAVRAARKRYPDLEIEVEIDRPDQLDELLEDPPDWVLLDNMSPDDIRECVARCGGRTKIEVSGGVTLETVAAYAAAGPDAISVGALTHSVVAMDMSLEWMVQCPA